MRAWWSMLLVPNMDTNLRNICACSLLCLDEPTQNVASGPLSLRIASSLSPISLIACSQVIFWYLPFTSFIGYLRRCECSVIPCSRTEAPLAQWAPRLIGESNTGSWRTQTPSVTMASIEQPTEQCVQTVRLTSVLPVLACAWASEITLSGSWPANAAAPAAMPEPFRNVRRSKVRAARAETARRSGSTLWALASDLRVSSMAGSSDFGRLVVLQDVLGGVITARLVRRRCGLLPAHGLGAGGHGRGDSRGAQAGGKQEVAAVRRLRGFHLGSFHEVRFSDQQERFGLQGHESRADGGRMAIIVRLGKHGQCREELRRARPDVLLEETLLIRERRRRPSRDPGDQHAHDLEQSGEVVLGLGRTRVAGESQPGERRLDADPRVVARRRARVVPGKDRHARLAHAGEQIVVLERGSIGIHGGGGLREAQPCAREPGVALDRPCRGEVRDQVLRWRSHEKAGQQRVEVGARGLFGRDHPLEHDRGGGGLRAHDPAPSFNTETSFFDCIMSTTRQSAHICSRRIASPPNIECPASRVIIVSTICVVPKGFLQLTQWKGCVSFSTRASRAAGPSSRRGSSVIASSGQVASHRPHCTQLRSTNLSSGWSTPSINAEAGHAPTHDMHIVQLPWSTITWPNGAPAGSAITSALRGACFARCSTANSMAVRLSLESAKVAGTPTPREGATSTRARASASGLSASIMSKWRPSYPSPCSTASPIAICPRSAATYSASSEPVDRITTREAP